ncbi:Hypothetical predicted protein [Octopus vulgaris]|uniref:Seven cysteines N-terminal domain-containing protein n=1 Tax=Octopus vulgaris TaxID=6645 RepID=A0AA36B4V9_OCTVU|nr:Hypothetical predicted protein [Octopus vulgaris]
MMQRTLTIFALLLFVTAVQSYYPWYRCYNEHYNPYTHYCCNNVVHPKTNSLNACCNDPLTRKCTNLESMTNVNLKKYMGKLTQEVEKKISDELPDEFWIFNLAPVTISYCQSSSMLLSILSVLTAVSTCIIPASGQQTCQTEILQNSTVDIDKYLNNELHILATFATLPPDALSNCILRCCNQSNCSLAIHNATDNHTCTLIHCVSEDACKPIPSDGSEMVKTIRNNITTTESLSENQSQTTESTSDTSTTASGIGLSTSSRGDHSTSSQQSTTQDSNLNQNVTSSKQETYLKNEADSNNTLMITVLIGTLSVGTLLFVAVIVVISKKIIDGWQKRHYSRIDYLVNGMYN